MVASLLARGVTGHHAPGMAVDNGVRRAATGEMTYAVLVQEWRATQATTHPHARKREGPNEMSQLRRQREQDMRQCGRMHKVSHPVRHVSSFI